MAGDRRRFPTWIGDIFRDYGFELGEDFTVCLPNRGSKGSGGHNRKDYLLTLDVAKEIAMSGNTPKGKATRGCTIGHYWER